MAKRPKHTRSRQARGGHFAARALTTMGAKSANFPTQTRPQLATLSKRLPVGDDWIYEIKFDGYRILAEVQASEVALMTRNRNNWSERLPTIVQAIGELPIRDAIFDGELVVLDSHGKSNFQALQNAMGAGSRQRNLRLLVFDLLYLDGYDLRAVPLLKRKEVLRELLQAGPAALRYSDHVRAKGRDFFRQACIAGLEGVIAKRCESSYSMARTKDWLKIKCQRRQEFVIVGYTDPSGSRVGMGALLLGYHDDEGTLRYAGKVGTGFTDASLRQLGSLLSKLHSAHTAVLDAPRGRGIHWVKPQLLAEVEYGEMTEAGKLRHPVFRGLRSDKSAKHIVLEQKH